MFSSRRPIPDGQVDGSDDRWIAERRGGGLSEPKRLSRAINRPRRTESGWPFASELGGLLQPDGSLLFWTVASSDGIADSFVATPARDGFGPPVPLGAPINSLAFESAAAISPDGRLLVFQREGATGGAGQEDLSLSVRTATGWAVPRLMGGGVSTAANESFPTFKPDGTSLLFASDRGGNWSVYVVGVASFRPQGSP